jgi:4a-hydroxytetrahydrobiopterin dehydratase
MKHLKTYKIFEWVEVSNKLEKKFEFKDFLQALKFINELSKICEEQNHHPEINWIYNKVKLTLSTHDAGDIVTKKDLKLSKSIDEILKNI